MDPGEWRLRSEAEPVSYYDTDIRQWTSGTFDFAVKSEHPAARSPGVQPQATAGQPGSLGGLRPGRTTSQLQSDVRPDEQAELRRQESGAPPQSMPALYQAPPPSAAFAAAAQHGSASTPALGPWDGMHRTSGHMPTTSATDAAQKWLNALLWGAKGSAPLADDGADGSYHRQYDRQHDPQVAPSFMSTPQATMQWPPSYHGGPGFLAGAESMRAPLPHQSQPASQQQHQWTASPYQSTGVPTSARLSQAHSTAPVTAHATAPFPPAPAVPPPPAPHPFDAQQFQPALSDVGSSHASHCTSIPSAVSTSVPRTNGGTPRSAQAVNSAPRVCACHVLADNWSFPKGPVQGNDKHVEEAVRLWARDCTKGGGGFGIRRAGKQSAASRGDRVRFQCAKDGRRTEDCKWECTFEESATGWILVHAVWEHNGHALLESAPQVMAARGTAFLPDELMEIAETAAASGLSIKEIDRLLTTAADNKGLEKTWLPSHLRSRLTILTHGDFDLSGLVETLKRREEENNTAFEMHCDVKGAATHIFVQLEGGMEDWASCPSNVLLFDPTWGTHRGGMKLCCFTMVACTGQTVVLAFALLNDEKADSILWSFRAFATHFKKAPSVVFTDDAPAIGVAFVSMHDGGAWNGAAHFLCTFHLAKNFFKHVKPVVQDPAAWREMNSWFWKFAKYSDRRFDAEAEWQGFLARFDAVAHGASKRTVQLWLGDLHMRRRKWMAVFTWGHTTWGVHSTQRAEAVHSALAGRKLKNLSAVNLIDEMNAYNAQSRGRRELDDVRKRLRQLAGAFSIPPLLAGLQLVLTPHAFDLLMTQFNMSIKYKSAPAPDCDPNDPVAEYHVVQYTGETKIDNFTPVARDDGSTVSWQCDADFGIGDFSGHAGHRTSLRDCTCQYPSVFGLPCRHILHLHTLGQEEELQYECSQFWYAKSPEAVQRDLQLLRAMPKPSTAAAVSSGGPSVSDRRALLLDDLLPLVDFASRNGDAFSTFKHCMPALKHALQHNAVLAIPNTHHVTAEPAAKPAAASQPTESPDQELIRSHLGSNFVAEPQYIDEASLDGGLFGRRILVKYGTKHWYMAEVQCRKDNADDGDRFLVIYSADDKWGEVVLSAELYWDVDSPGKARQWSWLLLAEAALSNHGRDVHEVGSQNRGRKQTARYAPPAGPTSRNASSKKATTASKKRKK